jgi:hypothetical protein
MNTTPDVRVLQVGSEDQHRSTPVPSHQPLRQYPKGSRPRRIPWVQPDPEVVHRGSLSVELAVVLEEGVVLDGVCFCGPHRVIRHSATRTFAESLDDLTSWPAARDRVNAAAQQLHDALRDLVLIGVTELAEEVTNAPQEVD